MTHTRPHSRPTRYLWLLAALLGAAALLIPPPTTLSAVAAENTVGVLIHDATRASPGYTLLAPKHFTRTYLIDNSGQVVNTWDSQYEPGQSAHLLPDGHLLRACMIRVGGGGTGGGEGGRIEEYDWEGNLVWEFDFATRDRQLHHDIAPLPNGNVLALMVERKTRAQAIDAGFGPALLPNTDLLPDAVVEIEPIRPSGGRIVWEWHTWDHLVQNVDSARMNYGDPAAHPELVNPNASGRQIPAFWNHMNSIDYNADLDQIALSVRGNSELWIIERSATAAVAAAHSGGRYGMGGDLLYRWGNPQMYGTGGAADQMLFQQHDVQWIDEGRPGAGHLLTFNNGIARPGGSASSVDEVAPPIDARGHYARTAGSAFAPKTLAWTYAGILGKQYYAEAISGAERMVNGNTLICFGTRGVLAEVTAAGEIVWQYVNPVVKEGPLRQGEASGVDDRGHNWNAVFKVRRYEPGYAGLTGQDLSPKGTIEIDDDNSNYGALGVQVAVGSATANSAAGTVSSSQPAPAFTVAQTLSDEAQRTTLAFSGLAMMTGNLDAQSFFPPGKVADYTGFQYLRDNDPDGMGHNTSFLTRVANNVIYILNDTQFSQLKTLASTQLDQINLYGYKRFPLMKAFRRLLDGDIPSGSAGLNLNAVKEASRELYILDGQISFDRALLYANILRSMDPAQKAHLDAMKGKGWNSWPDITNDQVRSKMQGLAQGTAVAVMTYAGDLFSWYAGSVEADVYFCPERQGTYYGSFYIKDAPAIGHEGYSINEQLTATAGAALSDSSKGYVTRDQAALMSSLVDIQRDNLYASPVANIVQVRTEIATLLRSLLTTTASSEAIKTRVLELSALYGELDGDNNHAYATVFTRVYESLTSSQKARLSALRTSIMSGTYADGTPFDYSLCTTPFLYSDPITDQSGLAPYLANTDYLFFEGIAPKTPEIAWASPASIVSGTALGAAQLNATASVEGTFIYSPAAGTVLAAGTHTLSVTFVPADTAHYTPTTKTVTISVGNAPRR